VPGRNFDIHGQETLGDNVVAGGLAAIKHLSVEAAQAKILSPMAKKHTKTTS
jgi:hypothetical protein